MARTWLEIIAHSFEHGLAWPWHGFEHGLCMVLHGRHGVRMAEHGAVPFKFRGEFSTSTSVVFI